ncbi:MAG: hypothetical protein AAFZ65_21015, partial [Planctomycetota bacterium]
RVVDAGGLDLVTSYERDQIGNLVRQVEPGGADRRFLYDALGLLLWEEAPELANQNGDTYRNRRDVDYDLDGFVIRTQEDNRDDLGLTLDPARRTQEFVRGNNGEVLSWRRLVADEEWVTEEYGYDGMGRRTSTRLPSAVNGTQPSNTEHVTYDERGLAFQRVAAQGFPEEHASRTDYDLNGLIVSFTEGSDADARTELTLNDGHDRVLQEVDFGGVVYNYTWSDRGELLQLTATAPTGLTPAQYSTTLLEDSEFEYDYAGRQVTIVCANVINGEEPADLFEVFDFAPNGDLVFEGMGSGSPQQQFASTPPAMGTTYEYDTAGRLIAEIGPLGDRIDYLLDAAGRRIQQTNTDLPTNGGAPVQTTITTQFDALGRSVAVQYSTGQQLQYGWSSHNELVRSVDAIGAVTTTRFDGLGRAVERIVADGSADARAQRVDWDASSRPIAFVDGSGNAQRIAWNGAGHAIGVRLPDGGLIQLGSGMTWADSAATPDLSSFKTGVDSFGRPTEMLDPNQTVAHM